MTLSLILSYTTSFSLCVQSFEDIFDNDNYYLRDTNGLTHSNDDNHIVFTQTHSDAITIRFKEIVYNGPNLLNDFDGYTKLLQCVKRLPISIHYSDMYHNISDFYTNKIYKDSEPPANSQYSADISFTASFLPGVALLCKFHNKLAIQAYSLRNPEHTHWGDDRIVIKRGIDNGIYKYN